MFSTLNFMSFIRRAWTLRWWNGRRMVGSNDRLPEWVRYAVPRLHIAAAVVSFHEIVIIACTVVLRPAVSRKQIIPISKYRSTIVSLDERASGASAWVARVRKSFYINNYMPVLICLICTLAMIKFMNNIT